MGCFGSACASGILAFNRGREGEDSLQRGEARRLRLGDSRRIVLILVVAVVVIVIGLAGAKVIAETVRLARSSGVMDLAFILGLLPIAVASYGMRVLRWHFLARQVVPGLRLRVSAPAQIIGFAFSATPGRVGEVYKVKLLEDATGIPAARILPVVVVERLVDLVGFSLVLIVGGLVAATRGNAAGLVDFASRHAWEGLAVGLGLVAVAGASAALASRGRRSRWSLGSASSRSGFALTRFEDVVRRLPLSARVLTIVSQLRVGGRQVLNPRSLALVVMCVSLGRVGDSIILWQISRAIGHPLSLPVAMLIFGTAGVVGGATFSPGGLGAAEAALVGMLVAHGLPFEEAMLGALGTRALTFWLWVVLGLTVLVLGYVARLRPGRATDISPSPRVSGPLGMARRALAVRVNRPSS